MSNPDPRKAYKARDERRKDKRVRELAERLGITLELAQNGLLKAREEAFKGLRCNQSLSAYLGRN